jgi:hypothetical protein
MKLGSPSVPDRLESVYPVAATDFAPRLERQRTGRAAALAAHA